MLALWTGCQILIGKIPHTMFLKICLLNGGKNSLTLSGHHNRKLQSGFMAPRPAFSWFCWLQWPLKVPFNSQIPSLLWYYRGSLSNQTPSWFHSPMVLWQFENLKFKFEGCLGGSVVEHLFWLRVWSQGPGCDPGSLEEAYFSLCLCLCLSLCVFYE